MTDQMNMIAISVLKALIKHRFKLICYYLYTESFLNHMNDLLIL